MQLADIERREERGEACDGLLESVQKEVDSLDEKPPLKRHVRRGRDGPGAGPEYEQAGIDQGRDSVWVDRLLVTLDIGGIPKVERDGKIRDPSVPVT